MLDSHNILEFDKVKAQLTTHCQTEMGTRLVSEMPVFSEERKIKYALDASEESLKIINALGPAPLDGASDVSEVLKRAEIEALLEPAELLEIQKNLSVVTRLNQFKNHLEETGLQTPIFETETQKLAPIRNLQDQITKVIEETGKVKDDATPSLRQIRQRMQGISSQIKGQMTEIMNRRGDQLTEALVATRYNRLVLPVKVEFKNSFRGIIHDQSASGNTFYIEPEEVVNLNRQIHALEVEERHEIEKVLRVLTTAVGEHVDELRLNMAVIGKLDFMFAKGSYGRAYDGLRPKISLDGPLKLVEARHPLIDPGIVVANDIVLNEGVKAMVITGPNTGGKTVTLKTVGLLSLMMQSGLLIPAHSSSEMPIFDAIFADIGDEQSIEKNLSTFSSHMKNVVYITENLTADSLVLFDEIGSGTDPKEGASLAMAILDDVKERARLTIATSHYSELKAHAYESADIVNASVEFNVETLSPTYRLLLGIPGRSNAFEISKKLGLNEKILDRATLQIGANRTEVSELIRKIEDKGLELDQLTQKAAKENKEALALRKDYEEKLAKFEQTREKELAKIRTESEKAIKEAREEAEKIVKELRAMKKNANVKDHELIDRLSQLDKQRAKQSEKLKQKPKNERKLQVGDEVMILSLSRQGELLSQGKNGEWSVAIGMMSLNVKEDDIQLLKPKKKAKPAKRSGGPPGGSLSVKGNKDARAKLDLRGVRYEEAMLMLDQYFDQVMLAGYDIVTIIHGHGTGAIRNGVQKYLKQNSAVESFRFGGEGEGGTGATVVMLK